MRPSMLLGNRPETRLGEIIGQPLMRFFSLFLFGSMAKYKAIHAGNVAGAMVAAATKTAAGKFICEYKEMKLLINSMSDARPDEPPPE